LSIAQPTMRVEHGVMFHIAGSDHQYADWPSVRKFDKQTPILWKK